MRWTNFNISMPLADRCFGTVETEVQWQERRGARAQPAAADAPATPTDDKHAA